MIIGETLKIGDKVVVTIPKDSREWGYSPCSDGTIAEVTGFAEIHYGRIHNFGKAPGVYENRCWAYVKTPGKEWCENTGRLDLLDKQEQESRKQKWIESGRPGGKYLRPLPDTEFWEEDVIKCTSLPEYDKLYIVKIGYEEMGQKRIDGSPMPIYAVSDSTALS